MAGSDLYANTITKGVLSDAADAIVFNEISMGLNVFDKVGILIQRIEYIFNWSVFTAMNASADQFVQALTTSDQIVDLSVANLDVVDQYSVRRQDFGTAASGFVFERPAAHDFSTLAGSGLLIPPRPLYAAVQTVSIASAYTFYLRIFFKMVQLKDSEYLELLETRRAFN